MKPIAELLSLVRTLPVQAFAERHAGKDILVGEVYEKGRDPRGKLPVPAAVFDLVERVGGKPVAIGRDVRAMVQLDHAAVSRLHLVMAWAGSGWKVMDRSSNGSFIDEVKLPQQQPVPAAYGSAIRLGRAMVLRVFTPEGFYQLARPAVAGPAPAPVAPAPTPTPPADPRASTWRFAAVPESLLQPAEDKDELALDFDPAPAPSSASTRSVPRPAAAAPAPPPKPADNDGIEFEFDLDFGDGKGGFA